MPVKKGELKKKKILIVDDEKGLVDTLQEGLGGAYEVITAYGPLEALSKTHQTHPDLIITDIQMRPFNGIMLYEHLKGNGDTKEIPCIFITGYGCTLYKKRTRELGGMQYFEKPVKIDELREEIERIFNPIDSRD